MYGTNGPAGRLPSEDSDAATDRARQRMRELMRQFLRAPVPADEADTVDLPPGGLGASAAAGGPDVSDTPVER